ncbi:MAG: YraN family protein [Bacteroidales bacterium]|jgi:putative endonuclease|nr:YraN family protein [Bacteroidales bacterium]
MEQQNDRRKRHNELGKRGEDAAVAYLEGLGWRIMERNFVVGKFEVDIIAEDRDKIVFVEVKTRTDAVFAEPEWAVTRAKQRSIIAVANAYVVQRRVEREVRFDVMSIILDEQGESSIHHIPAAFEPIIA